MELQGTIRRIGNIETFAGGFQKRELVLLTDEQYPQPISIEFLQDKTMLLDQVKEGDKVKIGINIRGREWTSPDGQVKYFNSITGWRLDKIGAGAKQEAKPAEDKNGFEEEELPF
jgi:hypothetical protein|nr:MAG TPA: Single-strand binding protein, single stranded DNA-binding protein.3A [Caudoviricetes sp.]